MVHSIQRQKFRLDDKSRSRTSIGYVFRKEASRLASTIPARTINWSMPRCTSAVTGSSILFVLSLSRDLSLREAAQAIVLRFTDTVGITVNVHPIAGRRWKIPRAKHADSNNDSQRNRSEHHDNIEDEDRDGRTDKPQPPGQGSGLVNQSNKRSSLSACLTMAERVSKVGIFHAQST